MLRFVDMVSGGFNMMSPMKTPGPRPRAFLSFVIWKGRNRYFDSDEPLPNSMSNGDFSGGLPAD